MNDAAITQYSTNLLTGWAFSTLAETCALEFGQSPPSATYNEEGKGLPFFQGKAEFGDLYPQVRKWCSEPNKLAKRGDVLISVRAPVGPTNLAPSDCCIGRGLAGIRPQDQIPKKYVLFYLRSIEKDLAERGTGTTFAAITSRVLESLQIPIAPLNEQQRIVAKIDELFSELDAGVANLKRARALLKKYGQAVLKAAVTGELTRDWRERHRGQIEETGADLLQRILKTRRQAWETAELKKLRAKGKLPKDDRWKQKYKEPQPPDATGLPDLPSGWAWATFEQVTQDDARNGISVRGSDQPPGVPALKLNAIVRGSIDYTVVRYIPISEQKADQLRVHEGDFLVSRASGTLRFCGCAGIAPRPTEQIVFPDTMIRFRVVSDVLLRWVDGLWNSRLVRQQIEEKAKTSAGIWKVSRQDLDSIVIPLPPEEEQQAALDTIEASDSSEAQADKALHDEARRASHLRQSILKAAFAGKLVPQDPNDEPAGVLLERIRAERAARPKPARGWKAGRRRREVLG